MMPFSLKIVAPTYMHWFCLKLNPKKCLFRVLNGNFLGYHLRLWHKANMEKIDVILSIVLISKP